MKRSGMIMWIMFTLLLLKTSADHNPFSPTTPSTPLPPPSPSSPPPYSNPSPPRSTPSSPPPPPYTTPSPPYTSSPPSPPAPYTPSSPPSNTLSPPPPPYAPSVLKNDYYKKICLSAEDVVRDVVQKAVKSNPGIGAGLVRMHFHDCFIRGCDGSVLLDNTPGNPAEKNSPANNPSLRGFEVIDAAKKKLESKCPGKVSCADIVAFAARDSVYFTGGITYKLPGGRLDGRVSIEAEVFQNLPAPFFNASILLSIFTSKGMTAEELVLLSGAHSIGRSRCSSFANRLYNFTGKGDQDPSLDANFAKYLKSKCPPSGPNDTTVVEDIVTPDVLDNQYYTNINNQKVLFTSDQTLLSSSATSGYVLSNAKNNETWGNKFAKAMIKMGLIGVQTIPSANYEVRLNCRRIN